MGVQKLLQYADSLGSAVCKNTDFSEIARVMGRPVKVVLDGEGCLESLVSGFVSDDACGGQWHRTSQNVCKLVQALQGNRPHPVELIVVFDGLVGSKRLVEWSKNQLAIRSQVEMVLKHIERRKTPPPKVWAFPPAAVRFCVVQTLLKLGVPVYFTVDDYCQEVVEACRHNDCDMIVGHNGEFFALSPPRYLCAKHFRVDSKSGCVVTKEYLMPELCKNLGIPRTQLPLLSALLGNFVLTEKDLATFFQKLVNKKKKPPSVANGVGEKEDAKDEKEEDDGDAAVIGDGGEASTIQLPPSGSYPAEILVPAVAEFVAGVEVGLEAVGVEVFGSAADPRLKTFIRMVEYYRGDEKNPRKRIKAITKTLPSIPADVEKENEGVAVANGNQSNGAAEGDEQHQSAIASRIVCFGNEELQPKLPKVSGPSKVPPSHRDVMAKAVQLHSQGCMSPYVIQTLHKGEVRFPVMMELATHSDIPNIGLLFRDLRRRVYAVLFNYHHHMYTAKQQQMQQKKEEKEREKEKEKGKAEKKEEEEEKEKAKEEEDLEVAAAESKEASGEADKAASAYVVPEMKVREWVWSALNPYRRAEVVEPKSLGWQVPTVRRLWFGAAPADTDVRMQAFLSCMRSEALDMLVPGPRAVVALPRHLFVLVCVLRYMLTATPAPFLSLPELRAVLATALSPRLGDGNYLRQLEAQDLTKRGVQLAAAVNFGLEMAAFANSACGAPIPFVEICPWLLFDGKLFQNKLAQAYKAENLLELCEGNMELCRILDVTLQQLTNGLVWGVGGVGFSVARNMGLGVVGPGPRGCPFGMTADPYRGGHLGQHHPHHHQQQQQYGPISLVGPAPQQQQQQQHHHHHHQQQQQNRAALLAANFRGRFDLGGQQESLMGRRPQPLHQHQHQPLQPPHMAYMGQQMPLRPRNVIGGGSGVTPLFPTPRKQTIPSRGGHLEVAGIVVGHWEPNFSGNGAHAGYDPSKQGRNAAGYGGGAPNRYQGNARANKKPADRKPAEGGKDRERKISSSSKEPSDKSSETRDLPRGMIKAPGVVMNASPTKPTENTSEGGVGTENGCPEAGGSVPVNGHAE